MTPAQAIAQLDKDLRRDGQNAVLKHMTDGVLTSSETVRVFVRGYKPDELTGDIEQGDRNVILSPTGLLGGVKSGDKLMLDGSPANVQDVKPLRMAGVLVRIELLVRGGEAAVSADADDEDIPPPVPASRGISATKLQGVPVSKITPATGDVLTFDGSDWGPLLPGVISNENFDGGNF